MASRKQIRGAGPRESPFCCLVPWLSWPRIPIFSPIRLSEPPPLRATHRAPLLGHPCRPASHWPVPLRCCLRKSPVVLSTVSYETHAWESGKQAQGLCLPLGQGPQTIWSVCNQQVGAEWTSLWCARRRKSWTRDFQAWWDFSEK